MGKRRSSSSHWSVSLPGECVAVAVAVVVALVAAAVVVAVAESGPAAMDCGCVEVGYGCGYCYGCQGET